MPQIPNLINLAIPGFIALLLLEVVLDAVMRRDLYQFKDTAASLTMGTGSIVLSVINKALMFAAYSAVHRFAIFNIGYQWWAWGILFFAEDLTYYWFHRTSHESSFRSALNIVFGIVIAGTFLCAMGALHKAQALPPITLIH